MKIPDISNQTFNFWTVVNYVGPAKHGAAMWKCRCVCGNMGIVSGSALRLNQSMSCGCQKVKLCNLKKNLRFKKTRHPLYNVWQQMHYRCETPRHQSYHYYGGRGISVCPEWDDFMVFIKDMGERPEGYTLERLDNNGNYCKENCTWVPQEIQKRNTRKTIKLNLDGKTYTLRELSELFGIKYRKIRSRHEWHWPVEQIIERVPRN